MGCQAVARSSQVTDCVRHVAPKRSTGLHWRQSISCWSLLWEHATSLITISRLLNSPGCCTPGAGAAHELPDEDQDIGRDTGTPILYTYETPFALEGSISEVVVELLD